MHWEPDTSLETLREGARLRASIRQWMQQQDVMEVVTPPLSLCANTDAYVQSLMVSDGGANDQNRYLHTSPEFAMKRLLAAYPETDLYQIATVFRREEQGRFHNTQFSMLEWYRIGMDHHALMLDVETLLRHVHSCIEIQFPGITRKSYVEEVYQRLGRWPDELSSTHVQSYFNAQQRHFPESLLNDHQGSLDLLLDEFIVSGFAEDSFTVLYEYPVSQAALARVGTGESGQAVAERFELFFGQVELANGFHELNDDAIQAQRFKDDLARRTDKGLEAVPIDYRLLAALEAGLPDCAGVALGIDRLQMVLGNHQHISEVICFSDCEA